MKFAILAVLALQVEWAFSCTFQREDVLLRAKLLSSHTITEGHCFAQCLNREACTGLCYEKGAESCYLFADGDEEQPHPVFQCYSLHRDLVKPPQYTKKLTFIKKGSKWRLE